MWFKILQFPNFPGKWLWNLKPNPKQKSKNNKLEPINYLYKKNCPINNTSKLGALNPKESPLDSVLAARTTSFLAGKVDRGCRGLKPNLKDEHCGVNWDTDTAFVNVRGERSRHEHTEYRLTVATAMAEKFKGDRLFA